MPETEIAICSKCHHHLCRDQGTSRSHLWYNHFCGASKLPQRADPVTGKVGAVSTNSLGDTVYGGPEFSYCRDINPDGACPKYEDANA